MNRITPEFHDNRERYRQFFPAGYEFLRYPESHPDGGLRLGTSVNAHLYRGNSFLMYIRLNLSERTLTLSPHKHNKIDEGASDDSGLLFPDVLYELIDSCGGFGAGWAHAAIDDSFEIRPNAPSQFFTQLIELARSVGL